jgi:hypothetical protein
MRAQLARLGDWLASTHYFWSPRPFCGDPPWLDGESALVAWLLARSENDLETLEPCLDVARTTIHPRLASLVREGMQLAQLDPLPRRASAAPSGARAYGVPARKWIQLQSFVPRLAPASFVDWCAGKGHLGRTVARQWARSGVALEIDPALVRAGEALAARERADLTFRTTDVRDPIDASLVTGRSIVALHACGHLGDRALDVATTARASDVAWAPCCFHRGRDRFEPWSTEGKALDGLTGDELRLPTTDEMVASPHGRWQRRTAMAFRLGFDHLRAIATGNESYVSFQSVPNSWLGDGFEAFCRRMAERFAVALPKAPDWDAAERIGRDRTARARRLGLVRAAFRRPLEVWLDLDRAVWLTEQGLDVQVGTFCERSVTPRNILVSAVARG